MKNWIALAFSAFLISCGGTPKTVEKSFIDENIDFARAQLGNEIEVIEASGKCLNPVTLKKDSSVYYCGYGDWRSGFFPGSVWYLYELTGDTALLPLAQKYTWAIEEAKNLTWHHDIGFIVNCSFGNGLRLTADPSYKDVMVQAAKSLSTRFREAPQVIQSWNVDKGWQSERGWECPVIIDNMMNLELMFEATRLSGDSSFYNIAIAHADRTLQEHFRPDGELLVKGALLRFLALLIAQGRQCLSTETADTQRLKTVLQWLSAHYAEPLRVADAAGVCSFSASHFMRWFRQMTGQSFIAFLNEYRLNTAAETLRTTDETVLTIASRCGFENLSYFNRAFKAHFGMTPRDYRKK